MKPHLFIVFLFLLLVNETDKQKVLGESTVLGATGAEIQIAKIALAFLIGSVALIFGLRLLGENGQE